MHVSRAAQARGAILYPVLFAIFWATVDWIGASVRVSSYQVVWTRYATHLLLVMALTRRSPRDLLRTGKLKLHIVCSLLMLGMPLCFIGSTGRMPVPDAMLIFWSFGFMAAVLSKLWTGEKFGLVLWLSTAAAVAGAILLSPPANLQIRAATILPLGMAFCFAFYQVLAREMRDEPMPTRLFHTAFWVFLAFSLALPWYGKFPSLHDLAVMIAIGVLGYGALLVLDLGLETAPPVMLVPGLCTQPVWLGLLERKGDALLHGPAAATGIFLLITGMGLAVFGYRPRHELRNSVIAESVGQS